MKKLVLLSLSLISIVAAAQHSAPLLGKTSQTQLRDYDQGKWFAPSYQAYLPQPQVTDKLRSISSKAYRLRIFVGTWCGDTRREVPRMLKVLEQIGWSADQIEIIGVSNVDSAYKQSPTHEERGLGIYRVPTFVLSHKGKEIGRIVETPVTSLERDLLDILSGRNYTPQYPAYQALRTWVTEGILTDPNVNWKALAQQLKPMLLSDSDLNAAGYVLLAQGAHDSALRLLHLNAMLHPNFANCWDSLGEAYLKTGNKPKAIEMYKKALQLDPKNESSLQAIKILSGE